MSRRLFDLWRLERHFELVVCPLLLDELEQVLGRDRSRTFIDIDDLHELMTLLRHDATVVPDPTNIGAGDRRPG